MNKINTLIKITKQMKEEEIGLKNVEVTLTKGEESAVLYQGQMTKNFEMRGHHMKSKHHFKEGGCHEEGHHHGKSRMGKLDKFQMMLKALDKLNIEEVESGKLLTIDIEASELPEEFKSKMEKRKAMMRDCHHMESEEMKKHPKYEEMMKVKESLDAMNVDIHSLEFKTGKLQAQVDDKNSVVEFNATVKANTTSNEAVTVRMRKYA